MTTEKKLPPEEIKEPPKNPDDVEVNIDDAQIEEPKDDAFRKAPQPVQPPTRRRKKA